MYIKNLALALRAGSQLMYTQQIEDLLIGFLSALKSGRGKKMEYSLLPQKGEDASCAFMTNQPGDVVERLHSEKKRGEHEKEKQKK